MNKSESKYFNTAIKFDKALISLLEKKPFEYISVTDICKEAGVNRSTFYLHYENTADLLTEASEYMIDTFKGYFSINLKSITERFSSCNLSELVFINKKYLFPYLSFIKDNRQIFSAALSSPSALKTEATYQRIFDNIFYPILDRFDYPVSIRQYVMKFYLNGITAIIKEWLTNNCTESIDDITEIISLCILGKNSILKNSL